MARSSGGGTLKHENAWGLRKMAYEIRQRTEADYRWYRFEAPRELLGQLDHNLKIADGVLRFRIFKVDPDPRWSSTRPWRRRARIPATRAAALRACGPPAGRPRPRGSACRRGGAATRSAPLPRRPPESPSQAPPAEAPVPAEAPPAEPAGAIAEDASEPDEPAAS